MCAGFSSQLVSCTLIDSLNSGNSAVHSGLSLPISVNVIKIVSHRHMQVILIQIDKPHSDPLPMLFRLCQVGKSKQHINTRYQIWWPLYIIQRLLCWAIFWLFDGHLGLLSTLVLILSPMITIILAFQNSKWAIQGQRCFKS